MTEAERHKAYRERKKQGAGMLPSLRMIPLDHIVLPESGQPRKRFRPDRQAELTESIRHDGLLQPLVVRKLNDGEQFELVAGERRLRSLRALEWLQAPCSVRELDARAACRLRIIENLQREDLTPIEEAEGFATLLEDADYGTGKAKELAAELHKEVRYIYASLKLLRLPEAARAAVEEGLIARETAILVARVEDLAKREELAAMVVERKMTYTAVRQLLRNNAGKPLDDVPWDLFDADLEPAAGSCDACPKRCEDVCPDIDCWQRKRRAFLGRLAEQLQQQGAEIIPEEQAFDCAGKLRWDSGLVVLADKLDPNLVKPKMRDEVKRKTWDDLLPQGTTAKVVVRSNGTVERVLPVEAAVAAASKAGHKKVFAKVPGSDFEHQERERRLKKREEKIAEATVAAQLASDLGAIDRGLVVAEDFFKVPALLSEAFLTKIAASEDALLAEYLDPETMPEAWKLAKHSDDGGELSTANKWRLAVCIIFFGDAQGITDAGLLLARGLNIEMPKISQARVDAIRAEIEGRFEEPAAEAEEEEEP